MSLLEILNELMLVELLEGTKDIFKGSMLTIVSETRIDI